MNRGTFLATSTASAAGVCVGALGQPTAAAVIDPLTTLTPGAARLFRHGAVVIAQNGGADLLYWTGPADRRVEAVRRMRGLVSEVDGVLSVHSAASLRLTALAGNVVAFCEAGRRFSDPQPVSNPIPGNHGHPATEPIPFFVAGGHPAVPRLSVSRRPTSTVDVAPTVGRLLGLPAPTDGYDGASVL